MTATRGRHTSLGLQLSVLAAKRTNGVGKDVMSSGCLKCSARHARFVISQEIKISGEREAPRQAPEGPFPPPPGLTSHAYPVPLGDAWIFLKFHLFPHVRVAVPLAPLLRELPPRLGTFPPTGRAISAPAVGVLQCEHADAVSVGSVGARGTYVPPKGNSQVLAAGGWWPRAGTSRAVTWSPGGALPVSAPRLPAQPRPQPSASWALPPSQFLTLRHVLYIFDLTIRRKEKKPLSRSSGISFSLLSHSVLISSRQRFITFL